jgi:hypothetical protein
LIAIGMLIVGALIGSTFNFGDHPGIILSGDDLKCVDGEGGITQCTIVNPLNNNSFDAYDNDGQKMNCRFTKINYPEGNSVSAYVCE